MLKQPTFRQWFPVALMVGILAGFSVLISFQLQPSLGVWFGAPWAIFITWGAWFSIGAKTHRLKKFVASITGGVVFGWLTLVIAPIFSQIFGSTFGLPLTVVVVATTIVLLELTDLFEIAFVYFFVYAGYFAYFFGGFAGKDADALQAAVYYWILSLLGVVFGLITVVLKDKIFSVERVPFDQRSTIFDKEV